MNQIGFLGPSGTFAAWLLVDADVCSPTATNTGHLVVVVETLAHVSGLADVYGGVLLLVVAPSEYVVAGGSEKGSVDGVDEIRVRPT